MKICFTKSQLTDFYNQAVKGVKEITPAGTEARAITAEAKIAEQIPETKSTVQKLIQAIKEATPVRAEQEALMSAERAKRTGAVVAVGEKIPGERGFFAQLAKLKGSLPKAQFEGVRKRFSQGEIDSLFDAIEQAKILPLEKVSAKGGLANLFEGAVPTEGEISLLKEVFPEELIYPMVLAGCPPGGIVLDPFMGAGTTAVVALKLKRHYVGIDINPEYIEIAEKRIAGVPVPLDFIHARPA